MIPKKIHLCWLGGGKYSPLIRHCIDSWRRVLPDYEIVLWDTKRFDVNSVPWVKEAFAAKKYAFASDYIRAYALYHEGGIYLDSDVEVLKTFDPLLQYKSFIGFEAVSDMVEPAIIGSEAGMEWCREVLDHYQGKHFCIETSIVRENIAPYIISRVLQMHYPDMPIASEVRSTPVLLKSNELLLCPATWFSPIEDEQNKVIYKKKWNSETHYTSDTYCIHWFNGSWLRSPLWKRACKRILKMVAGDTYAKRILRLLKN